MDAPKELKPMLEQYLDTARAARLGEALTEEELLRLQQASLQTARELLATEGYFSPQITSTIEGAGADQVVRYDGGGGAAHRWLRRSISGSRVRLREGARRMPVRID